MNNFSRDVSDGENYTVLLNQLKPSDCSLAPLQTHDIRQRAEEVRKYFNEFVDRQSNEYVSRSSKMLPTLVAANTSHLLLSSPETRV